MALYGNGSPAWCAALGVMVFEEIDPPPWPRREIREAFYLPREGRWFLLHSCDYADALGRTRQRPCRGHGPSAGSVRLLRVLFVGFSEVPTRPAAVSAALLSAIACVIFRSSAEP